MNDDDKGLLWKLPVVRSSSFGKMGPGFGVGVGCGVGFGLGLLGGVGFGPGIPGMQVGFGFGAGCGVGLGFGYGIGKGIAQDEYRRYSNVGNPFRGSGNPFRSSENPFQGARSVISEDDISALVDDIVINTKKLIKATSREIDKWRRS